jgi:hypothetical protein
MTDDIEGAAEFGGKKSGRRLRDDVARNERRIEDDGDKRAPSSDPAPAKDVTKAHGGIVKAWPAGSMAQLAAL